MARERMLHDGEAKAGAAGFARAAAVDTIEALRQARQMLRRYADAGILDAERSALGQVAPDDAHFPVARGVADGIRDQVAQSARDLALGAEQVDGGRTLQGDAMPSAGQRLRIG